MKLSVEKVGDDASAKDIYSPFHPLDQPYPAERKKKISESVWIPFGTKANSGIFRSHGGHSECAVLIAGAATEKRWHSRESSATKKPFDVMGQEKKNEKDTVTIKNETLRKYFPRSYTPKQMEEKIIQLLDAWQKKNSSAATNADS